MCDDTERIWSSLIAFDLYHIYHIQMIHENVFSSKYKKIMEERCGCIYYNHFHHSQSK